MAFDQNQIGAENLGPGTRAAQDLRQFQHFAVQVFPTGVLLATTTTSGQPYILMNEPDSGEACSVFGAPNVAKSAAGVAVAVGNWITLGGSSSLIVGSQGNAIGQARTAAASGGIFSCRLF